MGSPTALEQLIARASDDELRATRRYLHRAYQSRSRLGWPAVSPFGIHVREPRIGDPILLPALCIELSAELVRRGSALPCFPCQAEAEQALVPVVTVAAGPRPGPVPSVAGTGRRSGA